MTREEIYILMENLNVESIGLYFGKEFVDEARLSIDMLHFLGKQIKGNVIYLNATQKDEWFLGKQVELNEEQKTEAEEKKIKGFIALKFGEDFIGTGKLMQDGRTISSFLPKERRVRSQ
jgi:NOL1/NOP2/fmu family ribosome biogenesis protein